MVALDSAANEAHIEGEEDADLRVRGHVVVDGLKKADKVGLLHLNYSSTTSVDMQSLTLTSGSDSPSRAEVVAL